MSTEVDRSPIGLWDTYWSKSRKLISGRDIVDLAKLGATAFANDAPRSREASFANGLRQNA